MSGTRSALAALLAVITAIVALPMSPAAAAIDVSSVVDEPSLVDGPIIIDSVDDGHDLDDPELLEEMAELRDGFDPAQDPGDGPAVLSRQQADSSGGLTVLFDGTHTAPGNVQAVVHAAIADWNAVLATNSSGPVQVAVIWKNLGSPSLLGSAGPNNLFAHSSLPTDAYYPVGLANTLLGADLNGPSTPELTVNLNEAANWYINTSGDPGSKIDLYSVVLHEIAHGLGFLGSPSEGNPGASAGNPTLDVPSFVFDRNVTFNGIPLLSDGNPNAHLRSNNLRILASDTIDTKLYAPGTWNEGSSFSHFDEAAHPAGAPGALMTPSLGSGQTERSIDGLVLGVMARMGWPMARAPITPQITGSSSGSGQITVNYSLNLAENGPAPDTVRAQAYRNGTTLDATVDVNATAGQVTIGPLIGGANYTIKLFPILDGSPGVAATTTATVSGAPGRPRAVGLAGSGLVRTVTWLAPEGGGATSYTIERSTDGTNWTTIGTTSDIAIGVALPEGVHLFRVRGNNAFGAGTWGQSIPIGVSSGVARPLALDGQISRLYQAYFLRQPDASGHSHWVGSRSSGVSLADVSAAFAASAEFQSTYGSLSNDQFLTLVYQNVLGRSPDAGGLAYWRAQLAAGADRGIVMAGFSESTEFINSTGTSAPQPSTNDEVYRLYVAAFLRFPDSSGFQYWVGARNSGTSLEAVAAAFVASPEFTAAYGSLTDERFVQLLYENVLGRGADSAGSAYWQGQLAAGLSRPAMLVGFTESPEFVAATGTLP